MTKITITKLIIIRIKVFQIGNDDTLKKRIKILKAIKSIGNF